MLCSCGKALFRSADGTDRCRGCHLYSCECTCRPETLARLLRALGFGWMVAVVFLAVVWVGAAAAHPHPTVPCHVTEGCKGGPYGGK